MDAAGKDGTIRAVMQRRESRRAARSSRSSSRRPRSSTTTSSGARRRACPSAAASASSTAATTRRCWSCACTPSTSTAQRLPQPPDARRALGASAIESIRDHEQHLARNGTVILKFWLNVSQEEQRERFLARIDEPEKNWKFSDGRREGARLLGRLHGAPTRTRSARPRARGRPGTRSPPTTSPSCGCQVAEIVVDALESLDLRLPGGGRRASAPDSTRCARLLEGEA